MGGLSREAVLALWRHTSAPSCCQKREEREHGDDCDVLEQKYRKGALTPIGAHEPLLREGLKNDSGGGEGEGQAHREARLPGEPREYPQAEQKPGGDPHLEAAGTQDRLPHSPEESRL